MSEMKEYTDGIDGRLDIAEEKIRDLEDIQLKLPKMKHSKKKEFKTMSRVSVSYGKT